jgi:hypothetical protein
VKKHAALPGGSGTVVCRWPVDRPAANGGEEQAVTGGCSPAVTTGGGCPAQA